MQTSAFQTVLQTELTRRCEKNPRYSLRAFARALGTHHSTLSQIIRGRRRLTSRVVERLGRKLKLHEGVLESLLADVARVPGRSPGEALAADATALVNDGLHQAILSLIGAAGRNANTRVLARALDATVDEVNVAIERLVRFGLLELRGAGRWHSLQLDAAALEDHVWRRVAQKLSSPSPAVPQESILPKPQPVQQFQIISRNPEVATRFYGQLFGWKIEDANALGYRRLSTGESGISGGVWPAPPQATPFVQLFIGVDDVVATVARAQGLGGRVVVPPQKLPEGDEMAVLADVEGIPFGVFRAA